MRRSTGGGAPRGGGAAAVLLLVAALMVLGGLDSSSDQPSGPSSDRDPGWVTGADDQGAAARRDRATPDAADRRDRGKPGGSRRDRDAEARPARPARSRGVLVVRVVDGDTLDLADGETVRLVGIDSPEVGECGYDQATAHLSRLVLGKRVRLGVSDEDRDGYGRLLRYVDVGRVDAGLSQIRAGLAVARYDSRDGYGYHPRENRYVAADAASPDRRCAAAPRPLMQQPARPSARCAPGYQPCVPPYPPDVDCADLAGPVRVTGADPHRLDADGDGAACE